MAKINHNSYLDTVNDLLTEAKNKGITHLFTDLNEIPRNKLSISGKELLNFGTCGYLGLELDKRLIRGGAEMLEKYGTQFSVSRTYLTSGIHEQLEVSLSRMYDNSPVVTYSSTSAAHISIIPIIINPNDAVILDQQVHISVQTAAQLLRQKGSSIEVIRHSNLDMLENRICELSKKHENIWYMIDGVYSMYGDVPPYEELTYLMEKYQNLHLYVDDAHGMGWCGKNGTGYTFSKVPKHPKVMLVTTLAKGFGVMGGLAIFPDEEYKKKVCLYGGPLGYSHPLTPALIGSAIAATKIFLSDEVNTIQAELQESINYCNQLLAQTDLIVVSNPHTPINCIGMGRPKVTYNIVKRLLDEGFFVNTASFPVVPMYKTGIRFTITRHVERENIKNLIDAIAYYCPIVLEEENVTDESIRKVFGTIQNALERKLEVVPEPSDDLIKQQLYLEESHTITDVNKKEWNSLVGGNGPFDWDGMRTLETVYKNNLKSEDNWEFYYFIIRDANQQIVLATFFTSTIAKDDMLSLEGISTKIEVERMKNPYYLTSRILTMGSMFTDGFHYFLDKKNGKWEQAVLMLLAKISETGKNIDANIIMLRDFEKEDIALKKLIVKEGFAPVQMPNTNIIDELAWSSPEKYLDALTPRGKRHIKYDVLKYEDKFEVEYKQSLSDEEAAQLYKLYKNVHTKNLGLNMFPYPKNILQKLSMNPKWEFIVLTLKPEFDTRAERKPVAVAWCYKWEKQYAFMIVGVDYDIGVPYKAYKQTIYQVLLRAKQCNAEKLFLGLTADTDKHKFGAKQYERIAYMQIKDSFNMEVIETMAATRSVA